jgi:hypothetical protein
MKLLASVLVVAVSLASLLRAQENEERGVTKVQKIEEVERGFWFRSAFGFSFVFGNAFKSSSVDKRQSSMGVPGPVMGLEMGFDLGQIASIGIMASGSQIAGIRNANFGDVSNDADVLEVGLGVRFALMTTKRLAWFLKVGGSYLFAAPDMASFSSGFVVGGGTGLEYATNLRHFFIGVELVGQFHLPSSSVMAWVTPTLKYTF